MEKKGTAMSLRRNEYHSDRPKNRRLVNTGGEYISPEFQTYLLNKPYIYRDYVKEIKSPNVVEKFSILGVSPLVKPSPSCRWCTSTPKIFSSGAKNMANKLMHSTPKSDIRESKRGSMLRLNRPLTSTLGRAERIRYGIVEEDEDYKAMRRKIRTSVLNPTKQTANNLREAKKIRFDVAEEGMEEVEDSNKENESKEQLTESLAADLDLDEAIRRQKRRIMLDYPHPRHDPLMRNLPMLERYNLFDASHEQSYERKMQKDESDSKQKE
ncbi:hypothetical protein HELRODRAFT_179840 [Helobdella robusta]|uniref:Uncharacterized protein n=1 Tax=Helobdella robusta TaxID=6412 RepID=T1FF73_HELRO|nr:hypothetical protein HELRODRAFT_179840 [Helobdella robusta]ESN94996.1 hypothetical protein HELRODRAFT_179840 [Helobdella robusta]